jgi:pimeloyl-ACP methyl ester carboxylesterase
LQVAVAGLAHPLGGGEQRRGDLPAAQAAFMADAQVPWNVDAPAAAVTDPAWRAKPSWYLVTTEDKMIPPPAQHTMAERIGATVSEVTASHSVYVSQPEVVATLIAQAAASAGDR